MRFSEHLADIHQIASKSIIRGLIYTSVENIAKITVLSDKSKKFNA